ncbi:MAG: biotin/lipoyl-binding protein [Candidatus Desulforudis sp.]|nr:biotin/lipoyl-binding protein [Desulforudis sp.]
MSLQERVDRALEKGALWLKAQQKAGGGYGQWGPGSTGFAVMALLAARLPASAPAVADAVAYILNCRPSDSTHFRALTIMALLASGPKTPDILRRAQSDTDWLIGAQHADPEHLWSYGGWGHCRDSQAADGSNTQFALLALREAGAWGLTVPPETWRRALAWYRQNHAVNKDGSFVYSPGDHPLNSDAVVLPAMTAGALCGLMTISLSSPDQEVRSQARNLAGGALERLGVHHAALSGTHVPYGWHYHYLFSLGHAGMLEPAAGMFGARDRRDYMADFLVSCQQPDGRWVGAGEKESTAVIYTSLALLTLTGVTAESEEEEDDPMKEDSSAPGMSFGAVAANAAGPQHYENEAGGGDMEDIAEDMVADEGAQAGGGVRRKDTATDSEPRETETGKPAPGAHTGAEGACNGKAYREDKPDRTRNPEKEQIGGKVSRDGYSPKGRTLLLTVIILVFLGMAVGWWINKYDVWGVFAIQNNQHVLAVGEGVVAPATRELYGKEFGLVTAVEVEPGDSVTEGQAVLRIDSRETEFALSQLQFEIDKCWVRMGSLSQGKELELKSELAGIVTGVYVQPGADVTADTVIATLLSDRLLDVTLSQGGPGFQLLDEGLAVDLYLPEHDRVEAVLVSPVTGGRAGEEGTRFRVRILREYGGVLPTDDQPEGPETGGEVREAPGPRIVLDTVDGQLETLCAVEKVEFPVRAAQDGRLADLYVAEGDTVAAGQPLGRVVAGADLAGLKAEQIELNRLREAQRHLQERLADYTVVSPVAGKVAALLVEKGAAVRPDVVLAHIKDPDRFQVSILLEEWALPVSQLQGLTALVTVGGEELNGTVDRVVGGTADCCPLRVVVVFYRKPGIVPGIPARVQLLPSTSG